MGFPMCVPFSPWSWLLLLVALKCSEASSDLNESANSTTQHEPNIRFAAASSEADEKISVFALDYDYVQIPYEVTLWILLASLAKIGFHLYHRLPGLMPESCLLIIVGALVGAIIFGTDHKSPPVMDSSIYFLYLLPPIVLEGGYFMPTRPFFENIGSILWWAGLGALINAFGIGLSLYLICQIEAFGLSDVNLLQNLLFGSLISAVDPVAVLAVFEEARVNEPLYMMIFGEALLNDGISVGRWVQLPLTVSVPFQYLTYMKDTNHKPDILDPIKDTLEVELGKPLTLNCTARFGYQKDFRPVIKWYIRDSDREWEVPTSEEISVKSTKKDKVIARIIHLKEVTQRELHRKFICFAQNSIGNTTQSLQLKEKQAVVFLYILLGTIMTLAGVLTAAALLYMYWIEIVLLYRTYQSKDETLGVCVDSNRMRRQNPVLKHDKKVFDAFVSYAKWSSFGSEATSFLSEEYLALNLFPEVLENKYGYNLCLLERDVAPGGVYAEDIVNVIKKSRRGIFILSPKYVNGPTIFELQAAVNLALDDQTLKLILIKFCSFQEPESLPHLVKRALRVLPTVTWRNLKSVPPNSRFWTQIRYHMPVKNSKGFRWNHLGSISEFFHWK